MIWSLLHRCGLSSRCSEVIIGPSEARIKIKTILIRWKIRFNYDTDFIRELKLSLLKHLFFKGGYWFDEDADFNCCAG